MDDTRFERLNRRQKECLQLYHGQFEAKEIARQLGISPHTVNEHLRDARRILGVDRSIQAARLLAEYERDNRLGTEPIGIGSEPPIDNTGGATSAHSPIAARRSRYRLSPLIRIVVIVAIAFGVAAATGALIEAADVITRLITSQHIELSDHPHQR